jgi:hypothetical protein
MSSRPPLGFVAVVIEVNHNKPRGPQTIAADRLFDAAGL